MLVLVLGQQTLWKVKAGSSWEAVKMPQERLVHALGIDPSQTEVR